MGVVSFLLGKKKLNGALLTRERRICVVNSLHSMATNKDHGKEETKQRMVPVLFFNFPKHYFSLIFPKNTFLKRPKITFPNLPQKYFEYF